jgi:hypothetical protein
MMHHREFNVHRVSRVAQQQADERYGQIRRDQYCIFVAGRTPLTNEQAAREIIAEAKHLLEEDLQAMGLNVTIEKTNGNRPGYHTVYESYTYIYTYYCDIFIVVVVFCYD